MPKSSPLILACLIGVTACAVEPAHRVAPDDGSRSLAARVSDRGTIALTPAGGGPGLELATVGRAGAITRDGDEIRIERDDATELVAPVAGGIEQSWELAERPPGAGDFVVRVAVDGDYLGASDAGLHFAARGATTRFRYGIATWIDARGERTAIAQRYLDGAIEMAVPRALLAASAFPAVLDPVITPEAPVDDPDYGPAFGDQDAPALAFDGAHYLAVWRDASTGGIDGARLLPDGTLLDQPRFRVAAVAATAGSNPAVAWDGDSFVVAFADGPALKAVRVGADGVVRDAAPRLISATCDAPPRIASDGLTSLVVWPRGGDIVGAVIDRAGVAGAELPIGVAASVASDPAITWTGDEYFVAWNAGDDLHGTAVSAAGVAAEPAGIPLVVSPGLQDQVAVASRGGELLLAWQDTAWRVGLSVVDYTAVVTQRFSPSGAPLEAAPRLVSLASGWGSGAPFVRPSRPDVIAGASTWLVTWQDCYWTKPRFQPYAITDCWSRARRLELDGAPGDADPLVLYGGYESLDRNDLAHHALHFDGARYLVLAPHSSLAARDIQAYSVGEAGFDIAGPIVVSTNPTASDEVAPGVAWGTDAYLMAWLDGRDLGIYARRIAADGTLLGARIAVTPAPHMAFADAQSRPVVTFDGANFWVLWNLAGEVKRVRVTPDGTVLEAPRREVFGGDGLRAVSDGQRVLVIGNRRSGSAMTLEAQFYDRDGAPIGARRTLEYVYYTSRRFHFDVDVVGDSILVLIERQGGYRGDTGYLFYPGGEAYLDRPGVAQSYLANDGTNHVVLGAIYASGEPLLWRYGPRGELLETSPLSFGPGPIVASGDQLLKSPAGYVPELARFDYRQGIEVQQLGLDGVPVDAPRVVALDVGTLPAIASSGDRRWLVAYSRYVADADIRAYRVEYRIYDARAGLVPDDTEPPAIACPPSTTYLVVYDPLFLYPHATAVDAVDPAPLVWCDRPFAFYFGTTPVTCTALDNSDNASTCTFQVTVLPLDSTPPELTVPATITVAAPAWSGAVVTYEATAWDQVDGSVAASCSHASGSLFPRGVTTVVCTAADAHGNLATASFEVRVEVAWSGFLPPINASGSSVFKLGRTVPVKLALVGASAGITDAVARLAVSKVSSQPVGSDDEASSSATADTGAVMRYDATDRQYVYNLSTKALSTGTWRVSVDLGDGVTRAVSISLRD